VLNSCVGVGAVAVSTMVRPARQARPGNDDAEHEHACEQAE
jgi:hypothetical protein